MQYIFLAYHYFHFSDVYNSVRVFISCYVWMTVGARPYFHCAAAGWVGERDSDWTLICSSDAHRYAPTQNHTSYHVVGFRKLQLFLHEARLLVVWRTDNAFRRFYLLLLPLQPIVMDPHLL